MYLNCLVLSLINSIHFLLLSGKDTTAKVYHRKQWTIGNMLLITVVVVMDFSEAAFTTFCELRKSCFWCTLQWRHNERDSISNRQSHNCLFNCLLRRRPQKTSKLRVTGLCAGKSPVTGEFPAQRVSNQSQSFHGFECAIFYRLHTVFLFGVILYTIYNLYVHTSIAFYISCTHSYAKLCD